MRPLSYQSIMALIALLDLLMVYLGVWLIVSRKSINNFTLRNGMTHRIKENKNIQNNGYFFFSILAVILLLASCIPYTPQPQITDQNDAGNLVKCMFQVQLPEINSIGQ